MAKFSQTSTKVSQMMEIAFDISSTSEKRETAISNLLVLAKENAGTKSFFLSMILQIVFFVNPFIVTKRG